MTNAIAILHLSNLFLKHPSPAGLGLAASVIFHIGLESQFYSGLIREQDPCDFSVSSLCFSVLLNFGTMGAFLALGGDGCMILPFLIFCHYFNNGFIVFTVTWGRT